MLVNVIKMGLIASVVTLTACANNDGKAKAPFQQTCAEAMSMRSGFDSGASSMHSGGIGVKWTEIDCVREPTQNEREAAIKKYHEMMKKSPLK